MDGNLWPTKATVLHWVRKPATPSTSYMVLRYRPVISNM